MAPTPKEKTHECAVCAKAFRHKGNLMRHMQLHDPDNKHGGGSMMIKAEGGGYDGSQLIDDEYYEDEEDLPCEVDTDAEGGGGGGNVSIVTTADGGTAALLEATGSADGTIAITLDAQTQQLINQSGNGEQVMFVVQYPDEGDGNGGQGTPTVVAVQGGGASTSSAVAAPRIISRGGRVTRSSAKGGSGGGGGSSNSTGKDLLVCFGFLLLTFSLSFFPADLATLFVPMTSGEEVKPSLSNGGDGSGVSGMSSAPAIAPFDPSAESAISLEEQLQKQKDLEACFGFKVRAFLILNLC